MRVVLTTIGSLGDLYPYLAIGLGLKARGHEAVIATGACYRRRVEPLGLGFRALRPDSAFASDPAMMSRFMDLRRGTVRILREMILPAVRLSYEDTTAAAAGADLLVSHPLSFTTRLVAEKAGVRWASTQITPLCFASAFDPPMLPGVPELSQALRFLGPKFWGPLSRSLKWATRSWAGPLYRLRPEIGLPRADDNPLVVGQAPALDLALFSKLLAGKQPDWPAQTLQTGFPWYDRDSGAGPPTELARFLDDGPPPVVFTLGASAASVAGSFFEQSAAAAQALGVRAVLISGRRAEGMPTSLPEGVAAFDYAPFSELFPRASVVVHAGGIGTTGLAMRSGRPMLVVPFAHDQPDNAARLTRLGIALTIYRRHYNPARAAAAIRRLLEDPAYTRKASEVGGLVRQEDGVQAACDALESFG